MSWGQHMKDDFEGASHDLFKYAYRVDRPRQTMKSLHHDSEQPTWGSNLESP
jgi:hypothetical protein